MKKSGALAAVLGSPADDENEAEGGETYRADLVNVAHDLLAAVKAGDAEAVADALEAAHDVCSGGGE